MNRVVVLRSPYYVFLDDFFSLIPLTLRVLNFFGLAEKILQIFYLIKISIFYQFCVKFATLLSVSLRRLLLCPLCPLEQLHDL